MLCLAFPSCYCFCYTCERPYQSFYWQLKWCSKIESSFAYQKNSTFWRSSVLFNRSLWFVLAGIQPSDETAIGKLYRCVTKKKKDECYRHDDKVTPKLQGPIHYLERQGIFHFATCKYRTIDIDVIESRFQVEVCTAFFCVWHVPYQLISTGYYCSPFKSPNHEKSLWLLGKLFWLVEFLKIRYAFIDQEYS